MAETESVATDVDGDIASRLAIAVETAPPKVRPPTKEQQLREQRTQIAALRLKGYSLTEVAAMVGVSKDTLRKALSKKRKKATPMAANAARPKDDAKPTSMVSTKASPATLTVVPPGRKRKFPSNEDL
jgi:lambda repressor-like predicted transcriptional regulator